MDTENDGPGRREFLGWDGPALPAAAEALAARFRDGPSLDLSRVVVVVPGHRAGRRLSELLAFLADDHRLILTPPRVVTEGQLPELLYRPPLPFANELTQHLAWARSLADTPEERRRAVFPSPPARGDRVPWLGLGDILRRLHVELAADALTFADVVRRGPGLAGFPDLARWEALAEVQRRYLELLGEHELCDRETARLDAIARSEVRTDSEIVLLGMSDLNGMVRQMLAQVRANVTAFVVAPADRADGFDALGCLVTEYWRQVEIPLADAQVRQVDGPGEQADAVAAWLADLGGRFQIDEVAVGVPDETLAPQLQRQLEQCGVRARWVGGTHLRESAPYRLLAAAVSFAGQHRYEDLAALVRHPDVETWLGPAPSLSDAGEPGDGVPIPGSWPAQLDRFYNVHLPSRVRSSDVPSCPGDWPDLPAALARIDAWLKPAEAARPFRAWADLFRAILGAVYGDRTLDLDLATDQSLCRSFSRVLEECDRLAALPEGLDPAPVSAGDAFQAAFGPAGAETVPPPADPGAVELLGWLELPLDDAPALAVTTFNEGFVPQAAGADSFLPDRLRAELRLLHSDRRYARDAYATSVLCHSRKDLCLVVARRDARNDPLRPSPLLFACPEPTLLRRAAEFFSTRPRPGRPRRSLLARERAVPAESRFEVPRPVPRGRRLKRIAVTEFKAYLACPYRYYLRYVRRLSAVDDGARELDGGGFGTLLHQTLGAFGNDAAGPRHSDREREIAEFLESHLTAIAETTFGSGAHRAAVRLQLEQARRRLRAFAANHADVVRAGWHIAFAEQEGQHRLSALFAVEGEPITLVGRIDRIDVHSQDRKVRVLDYKSGERARRPDQTHRVGEVWVDLQLPLYRHLWQAAVGPAMADWTLELGYVNLPKSADEAGICVAEWDEAALATADEAARTVVRGLRAGVFWEPCYPAPAFCEDFAAICMDAARSRPVLGDGDGGAA